MKKTLYCIIAKAEIAPSRSAEKLGIKPRCPFFLSSMKYASRNLDASW
jgi:hypothetical protein